MIAVTRLDGSKFFLNSDLIESIEATPDTVLTMTTQKKLVVRESPREILDSIIVYRRRIFAIGPQVVDK